MKKIVFSNLPMKQDLYNLKYAVDGNSTLKYEGEVKFPVNAVLAKSLKCGDRVTVVLLSKSDIEGNSAVNAGLFQQELNAINSEIGAKIEYVTITTPFEETREVHEALLRDMIAKLENGAEIIGDVTFGPKPLPLIMFSVMRFAEKFFDAKISNIVYGKVDFPNGSKAPVNPVLYDLTPLYYLNSVTDSIECNNSAEAVKALDILLSL